MLTRSASYPDRETAHWATQQVVTANEQVIHRRLALGTRARLTIEAAWPSRKEPVGRVQLEGDLLARLGPVDVRAARGARRAAPRAVEHARFRRPHDRPVLPVGAARTCP